MPIETVQIKSSDEKTQGAFVNINKCDFDKEIHELFKKERKPRSPNKPKVAPIAIKEVVDK